jgi:hypothetical protein
VIHSDSNNNTSSYCNANRDSYKLPAGKGSKFPSINGGEYKFKLKQFEVYSVKVRMINIIIFRNNEMMEGLRETEITSFIC